MPYDPTVIRYASGEDVRVGDRVDADGWHAIVEEVLTQRDDFIAAGLDWPGIMLDTEEAGLVFQPVDSVDWDAIVFLGRHEA